MGSTQNNQDAPDIHTEHVKEEFYKWFESRGLLSELRSYMRQLMVKALEETNKNGVCANQRRSATSPKLQAINLLIVDHLFHEDYLYTVSVFSSEARILESLPQYSGYVTDTLRQGRWEPGSVPRFTSAEAEDILDTLRLPNDGRAARRAARAYREGQESLMMCAVRALASQATGLSPERVPERSVAVVPSLASLPEDCQCPQLWSQEMQDLLLLAGVKLHHIRRMQMKWTRLLEEERRRARLEEESCRADWQRSTEQKLRQEMLGDQQALQERCSEVELRENRLASMAQQLSAVHEDISLRMSELQLQRQDLEDNEERQQSEREELEQRETEITEREEQLQSTLVSLHRQTELADSSDLEEADGKNSSVNIEESQKKMDQNEVYVQTENFPTEPLVAQCSQTEQQIEMKAVYSQTVNTIETQPQYTQTLDAQKIDHEQQTSRTNQPDSDLMWQLNVDRQKINELQEENLELRAHALQQRQRIDELTNRTAQLANQLRDSQVAIDVLSGRESAVVAVPPAPPHPMPPQVFIAPTFGYSNPQRIGAGEESLFAPRPQQAPPRADGRRRPSRFAFSQNPYPASEESSPTDDVVREARARIQELEVESSALQRSYEEFHHRVITSDSLMFPPLRTPRRLFDPVMRVRRSEVIPPRPSYSSRCRIPPRQTEEVEDSSTDHSLLCDARIEDITNSRRIFSNRSMRQFERWKQFKKKFQRRSFDRRNALDSSSEDEEIQMRNRRRHEKAREQWNQNTQTGGSLRIGLLGENPEVNGVCKSTNPESKQEDEQRGDAVDEDRRKQELKTTQSHNKIPVEVKSSNVVKSSTLITDETREKLKFEMEQSIRLIESVKHLLGAQNFNINASTLSNSSWAVESLPKDSDNELFPQSDVLKTENSSTILTAMPKQMEKINENDVQNLSVHSIRDSLIQVPVLETKSSNSFHDNDNSADHNVQQDLQENALISPSINVISSQPRLNSARVTVAVAGASIEDHEDIGERGTTSVTSGSDILRELNPSKEESSESILSIGCEERSKNSSDFWN